MSDFDLPTARPNNRFISTEKYDLENWKPTVAKPVPSLRCYIIKKDGFQCKNFAILGTGIGDAVGGPTCKKHAPLPAVREKAEKRVQQARLRLLGMSQDAVKVIEDLMFHSSMDNVRLAAAKDILDRAGLKSAVEVNVTVEHSLRPMDAINEKLAIIMSHNKPEVIEDAEIIDEGESNDDLISEETEENNE